MSRMTKTMVLAGAVLSAATGCVTVPGAGSGPSGSEPAPRLAPAPATPTAGAPGALGPDAAPHEGEAPAREALSRLDRLPGRRVGAALARSGGAALPMRAPSPSVRESLPAPGADAGKHPSPTPARRPEAPGFARENERHQRADSSDGSEGGGGPGGRGGGSDVAVCALGEAYGRWAQDSPQARICRAAYGK
ncbi:hypothetical protein [Streptomyces axinellae]|uniref:Lipoprotein n=1 Tax=Streptomyces axinellae TaxID=552788 RepID=A0ABP6CM41_9ACTN